MAEALYRALRSRNFSEMLGQEHILRALRGQVVSGRVSHAYLFCGTRGTGKTSAARIFARAINCSNPVDGDPCGTCDVCAALGEDNMDVIEIDAASNNGVDEIRDLRDRVKYPPQFGRYRVYIIDEVHMLSPGAFNALLKTLEEPPAHAVLILATTEPQRLPATILSRCQRFDFHRIPLDKIVFQLKHAVDFSNAQADEDALLAVARAADGAMRDALSLLDMCLSMGGGHVSLGVVNDALGASGKAFLLDFAGALSSGDAGAALSMIERTAREGRDAQTFAREAAQTLQSCLIALLCGADAPRILEVTPGEAEAFKALGAGMGEERAVRAMALFTQAEADMRWAARPRAMLELAAMRACRPEVDKTLEGVQARLDALEQRVAELAERGVAVRAAPAQPAPDKPAAAPKPSKKPAPKGDASGKAVYDEAMKSLQKDSVGISVYTLLKQFARYGALEGDTLTITIVAGVQNTVTNVLEEGVFAQKLSDMVSEAAGRPIVIRWEREGEAPPERDEALEDEVVRMFGRENVTFTELEDV